MVSIRFRGLVGRMHRVREQLVVGIPEDKVADFRNHVQSTIQHVEQVCAAHRATPLQLPTPSYQAYQFLKTLDLDHLPLRDPDREPVLPPLRMRNLLHRCARIQTALARIVDAMLEASSPLAADDPRILSLVADIQSAAAQVEEIARAAHSHVARLARPSRQAYEWLKFLCARENLEMHLHALYTAHLALKEIAAQKKYAGTRYQLSIEFYNAEYEWRVAQRGAEIHAVISEGFVGADAPVIQALVRLAFQARRRTYRQVVRKYTTRPEYAEMLQIIELPTAELDPNVRGRHHDLRQVFERVNRRYFYSQLTPPRLTWNKSSTFRVMGHYQYATDTIMISISLDSRAVPDYVIDHVMHHELLHRLMGAQLTNGRLLSHTPAFRAAERAFPDYARADAFLNELSAKLRHGS